MIVLRHKKSVKNYTLSFFLVLLFMKAIFARKETDMSTQSKQMSRKPLCDEKIIDLYWERDERAIEETDFKYKNYLFSITYNILHDKLDCEECLNDTYLGVWNAIPPTRPNMLKAFLTTISRRIAIKRYNSINKKSSIPSHMTVALSELDGILSDEEGADDSFDAEALGKIISSFILSLPDRQRFIFMSRYYVFEPIDTIAKDLNVSRSTVNKELSSIRCLLKEMLESEGYSI